MNIEDIVGIKFELINKVINSKEKSKEELIILKRNLKIVNELLNEFNMTKSINLNKVEELKQIK